MGVTKEGEEIMKNFEKMIEDAEKVDVGNYDLRCDELIALAKMYNNNFLNGSFILFKIGFLKGQRAEKARQKKCKGEK